MVDSPEKKEIPIFSYYLNKDNANFSSNSFPSIIFAGGVAAIQKTKDLEGAVKAAQDFIRINNFASLRMIIGNSPSEDKFECIITPSSQFLEVERGYWSSVRDANKKYQQTPEFKIEQELNAVRQELDVVKNKFAKIKCDKVLAGFDGAIAKGEVAILKWIGDFADASDHTSAVVTKEDREKIGKGLTKWYAENKSADDAKLKEIRLKHPDETLRTIAIKSDSGVFSASAINWAIVNINGCVSSVIGMYAQEAAYKIEQEMAIRPPVLKSAQEESKKAVVGPVTQQQADRDAARAAQVQQKV